MRVAEQGRRTHRRPKRPALIGAVHTRGADQALLSRQKQQLCCRMDHSVVLPKMMVLHWNQAHDICGHELEQFSHSWICSSSCSTALHKGWSSNARGGTSMPGLCMVMVLCISVGKLRNGMEGLLSPTSTLYHNSCPALFCLSRTAPLKLFLHSIGTVSKILFLSNIENITRRAVLFMLDLWNPFYQNRSISCFKLLPNFPFKVA